MQTCKPSKARKENKIAEIMGISVLQVTSITRRTHCAGALPSSPALAEVLAESYHVRGRGSPSKSHFLENLRNSGHRSCSAGENTQKTSHLIRCMQEQEMGTEGPGTSVEGNS